MRFIALHPRVSGCERVCDSACARTRTHVSACSHVRACVGVQPSLCCSHQRVACAPPATQEVPGTGECARERRGNAPRHSPSSREHQRRLGCRPARAPGSSSPGAAVAASRLRRRCPPQAERRDCACSRCVCVCVCASPYVCLCAHAYMRVCACVCMLVCVEGFLCTRACAFVCAWPPRTAESLLSLSLHG